MPPYGEPDWATPGDTSATSNAGLPTAAAPVTGTQNSNSADER